MNGPEFRQVTYRTIALERSEQDGMFWWNRVNLKCFSYDRVVEIRDDLPGSLKIYIDSCEALLGIFGMKWTDIRNAKKGEKFSNYRSLTTGFYCLRGSTQSNFTSKEPILYLLIYYILIGNNDGLRNCMEWFISTTDIPWNSTEWLYREVNPPLAFLNPYTTMQHCLAEWAVISANMEALSILAEYHVRLMSEIFTRGRVSLDLYDILILIEHTNLSNNPTEAYIEWDEALLRADPLYRMPAPSYLKTKSGRNPRFFHWSFVELIFSTNLAVRWKLIELNGRYIPSIVRGSLIYGDSWGVLLDEIRTEALCTNSIVEALFEEMIQLTVDFHFLSLITTELGIPEPVYIDFISPFVFGDRIHSLDFAGIRSYIQKMGERTNKSETAKLPSIKDHDPVISKKIQSLIKRYWPYPREIGLDWVKAGKRKVANIDKL